MIFIGRLLTLDFIILFDKNESFVSVFLVTLFISAGETFECSLGVGITGIAGLGVVEGVFQDMGVILGGITGCVL